MSCTLYSDTVPVSAASPLAAGTSTTSAPAISTKVCSGDRDICNLENVRVFLAPKIKQCTYI